MLRDIQEIAEHYGFEAQSSQLIEECAELIQAINKYKRASGTGQPLAEDRKLTVVQDVIEEIADVEIMLEQIKHLLFIPDTTIAYMKRYKVDRTKARISRE